MGGERLVGAGEDGGGVRAGDERDESVSYRLVRGRRGRGDMGTWLSIYIRPRGEPMVGSPTRGVLVFVHATQQGEMASSPDLQLAAAGGGRTRVPGGGRERSWSVAGWHRLSSRLLGASLVLGIDRGIGGPQGKRAVSTETMSAGWAAARAGVRRSHVTKSAL